MPQAIRLKDTHSGVCSHSQKCCPHNVTGEVVSGSTNVYINGEPAAYQGCEIDLDCPHCSIGKIISGSDTVFVNGCPKARVGDKVEYTGGSGELIFSSSNVYIG